MNANDYQRQAARTLIDGPDFKLWDVELMIIWNAIGLAGEAGEICEHVKKGVFHQHGLNHDKLKEEIGDCLWYLAALCTELDINLEDVMKYNIAKLHLRYPNGYSAADSINRLKEDAQS